MVGAGENLLREEQGGMGRNRARVRSDAAAVEAPRWAVYCSYSKRERRADLAVLVNQLICFCDVCRGAEVAGHDINDLLIHWQSRTAPVSHCAVAQTGQVWFLAGAFPGGPPAVTRSCTIPAGKDLLLPLRNALFGEGW
jgi:hypothetical protein